MDPSAWGFPDVLHGPCLAQHLVRLLLLYHSPNLPFHLCTHDLPCPALCFLVPLSPPFPVVLLPLLFFLTFFFLGSSSAAHPLSAPLSGTGEEESAARGQLFGLGWCLRCSCCCCCWCCHYLLECYSCLRHGCLRRRCLLRRWYALHPLHLKRDIQN